MGAATLALRAGVSELDAEHLLRAMAATFPRFTEWSQEIVDIGNLTGRLATVFGWVVHVSNSTRPTTLRNFPMQANAAEMLRIACCLATEHGVEVCAPIHDALLIQASTDDIDHAITVTVNAMESAGRAVLDGFNVGTDVTVTRWPDRYHDPRGQAMWERVSRLAGIKGV
jgi:DNA polymerase I-like protein with 3'-5' exonuclease and polymerase domains